MIIHKILRKRRVGTFTAGYNDGCGISYNEDYYLCNQAVKPTPSKSSYIWRNVTCKNCLQVHSTQDKRGKE